MYYYKGLHLDTFIVVNRATIFLTLLANKDSSEQPIVNSEEPINNNNITKQTRQRANVESSGQPDG